MREPIKIIRDIIKDFMGLDEDKIYIYNQDFKSNTGDLQVIIQFQSSTPYSNINKFIPADQGVEGAIQSLRLLTREDYTINILSKNTDARIRKEEILLALMTQEAQDKQGEYNFKISNISSSFIDVSEVEASGSLNRYAITISLLTSYTKEILAPYYDSFTIEDATVEGS
jgi:hypothetical protein